MKTKKPGKALTLKKKTIANLNNGEMTAIVGGHLVSHSPIEGTCLCPDDTTGPTWVSDCIASVCCN